MMEKRFYSQWAGSEKGVPENEALCIEEVYPKEGSWIPYQCRRKRGHGPDGLYCKQHAKKHERRAAVQAELDELGAQLAANHTKLKRSAAGRGGEE